VKKFSWILTHTPAVLMLLILAFDPSQWKLLTPYSGYCAVGFLILVLSLHPLKMLWPHWILLIKLNRHRQEIGVAAFSYAAIHVLCFLIKRGSLEATLPYLIHPALIPVVWVGFPVLIILALTSNQYSKKKLTAIKWKKLHKLVYLAEAAIFLHMILVGEKVWAFILFTPLVILQLMRRVKNTKNKRLSS
jgi:sulfoxide reductase heme-binding subunit YedZ